jgi:hypothetical protein
VPVTSSGTSGGGQGWGDRGGLRSNHRGKSGGNACGYTENSSPSNIKPAILSERASGGTLALARVASTRDHRQMVSAGADG